MKTKNTLIVIINIVLILVIAIAVEIKVSSLENRINILEQKISNPKTKAIPLNQ